MRCCMNTQFIRSVLIDWGKISQDSYLRGIPAISSTEEIAFEKAVTCFVGENGTGKSTLLEAIAVAYGFNPEGGTRNYSFLPASLPELGNRLRPGAEHAGLRRNRHQCHPGARNNG